MKHLWGLIWLASVGTYPMGYFAVSGQLQGAGQYWGALGVAVGWALPWLALAWYLDPAVRQRRYLRTFPWVEFPATVKHLGTNSSLGNVVVRFTDERHRHWTYLVAPNDADFAEGERPVWFAGKPGATAAVISLREGACTGMAYSYKNA